MRKIILLLVSLIILTGCDLPIQQTSSTERGVIFNQLPRFLGGGLRDSVVQGGQMVVVLPWERIIRVETGVQDVVLGDGSRSDKDEWGTFVFTRALDGNEVALRLTVRFQVSDKPEDLTKLIQKFASVNDDIRKLVVAVSRYWVRTKMNELQTADFLEDSSRYRAVDAVKDGIQNALKAYGIEILAVALDRFEFARLQPDGTVDTVYQEKLNEVQRLREGTERERLRIETVKSAGLEKFNTTQGEVNRQIAEAKGDLEQAKARGEGYLQTKKNEALAITAEGMAQVEGLVQKIQALSGPGGAAVVKLEVARALKDGGAQFIALGSSSGERNMSVDKTDTNQLLDQLGLIDAMKEENKKREVRGENEKAK